MLLSLPRFRSFALLGASLLTLTACSDMEYMYNRTADGIGSAYNSVAGGSKPKESPTQVEVSTPKAAPYEDVEWRNAPPVQGAVELGSMSDRAMPTSQSAMPDPIRPVAPQAQVQAARTPLAPAPMAPASDTMQAPASAQAMTAPVAPAVAPVETAPGVLSVAPESMGSPLMVIRFNQYHVYYDEALAKVVRIAESSKPGAQYTVVSALPDLTTLPPEQQADISKRAIDNLRDVSTQMQQLGVPASRIKVATQQKPVRAQEIAIYVN